MATIDLPPTLIELEHAAWTEIREGRLTVPTALAVHEAVSKFATEAGQSRIDVEMALKKRVRHPEPEAA
ncbi:hypothetical protein ACFCWG_25005 [Streptomyces sp. NPDC056390]|uniref:hypothetical protein n=1 Tax=Streptomyces sp. NPDC056390 TaxID=3345806 RepID=UPI0035E014B6